MSITSISLINRQKEDKNNKTNSSFLITSQHLNLEFPPQSMSAGSWVYPYVLDLLLPSVQIMGGFTFQNVNLFNF